MMDVEVQRAIRARLIGATIVTDLVPASSIFDRHERPVLSPSIILGETQAVDEGTSMERAHVRIYHTIHVWKREPSLEGVKVICGAIRNALHAGRLALVHYHAADCKVASIRSMRDPDGEHSHAVITVEVLVSGVLA